MQMLSVNVGSSSLKLDVWDIAASARCVRLEAKGVGARGTLWRDGEMKEEGRWANHADALDALLAAMPAAEIERVGHRMVHGGESFREPVWLTDEIMRALDGLVSLSPLHLEPALQVARRCRELLPAAFQAAVFDTAFHASLPPQAYTYALPRELRSRYRRYGFHGIACADAVRQLGPELRAKAVLLHLGAGCSATALLRGRSVDTTMGYTPLEGLVMATRSGDVDPGILLHAMREGGMSAEELADVLQSRSGLLGVSEWSADMRELLGRRASPEAGLAVKLFCYRAAKSAAGLAVALGGLEQLVFSGGIGENSAEVRAQICDGLAWLGIVLDVSANARGEGRVSSAQSAVAIDVVRVDEGREIAAQVAALPLSKK